MNWRARIGAAFGDADCVFAGHWADDDHAKELIWEARHEGASKDDFFKEMVWHVYKNVSNPEHRERLFAEQEKELAKLWK
jgi:hypothetical protein